MKYKILTANLCLFLVFSGVITISADTGSPIREESVFSATVLEGVKDLRYDRISDESPVIVEREKNHPRYDIDSNELNNAPEENNSSGCSVRDFLGWAGSNIQDFLGWAGSNIQDFLGWAGSNTYSGLAALGRGSIVLFLVVLLIMIVYGAIMI